MQIEKATKKKRTGKLGPFPSELSHLPHLARAHALLAHFEGTPPDTVPSATNTPQQGSRMMLRGRRKPNGEDEVAVTPPPTASRRGRGKAAGTPTNVGARTKLAAGTSATPTSTPVAKKTATAMSPERKALPSSASAPVLVTQDTEQVKAEHAGTIGEVAEGLARAMAGVTLQADNKNKAVTSDEPAGTGWQPAPTQLQQQSNVPPADSTVSASTSQPQESERSKVFLRFARPTPTPPSEPAEQLDTPIPNPIPAQQVHAAPPLPPQTVYPSLSALLNPSVPAQSSAPYSSDTRQAQLAYRESSAGAASASASSTTEGEYVSATGGMSGSEAERDQREGTGETTTTSSSDGPIMPGRFGRQ